MAALSTPLSDDSPDKHRGNIWDDNATAPGISMLRDNDSVTSSCGSSPNVSLSTYDMAETSEDDNIACNTPDTTTSYHDWPSPFEESLRQTESTPETPHQPSFDGSSSKSPSPSVVAVRRKRKPLQVETRIPLPPTSLENHEDICRILFHNVREPHAPPCLQCAVKGLWCDMRIPSCSRCERTGNGNLCLLQRPLFSYEQGWEPFRSQYVLLRLRECDEVWQEKLWLEERLVVSLRDRVDRSNWVLPNIMGSRQNFRDKLHRSKEGDVHYLRGQQAPKNIITQLKLVKTPDAFL